MIEAVPHPLRLLLLGGTSEASRLAGALAGRHDLAPILSLAGRTANPALPPIPVRIGGFGGAEGLAQWLGDENIDAVIDATHPFAARISAHAAAACCALGLPRAMFTRSPWRPAEGDRWQAVADLDAAALAIGRRPVRVFLTSGRLGLAAFRAAPQHHYLIRTIDPPAPQDLPPDHRILLARGPFAVDDEHALMREAGIDVLVAKNSGGSAGAAKLEAARQLGLPVILVEPPPPGTDAPRFTTLAAVLDWIARCRS